MWLGSATALTAKFSAKLTKAFESCRRRKGLLDLSGRTSSPSIGMDTEFGTPEQAFQMPGKLKRKRFVLRSVPAPKQESICGKLSPSENEGTHV